MQKVEEAQTCKLQVSTLQMQTRQHAYTPQMQVYQMVRTRLRRKNSPLPLFQPKRGRTFEKEVQAQQLQWKMEKTNLPF